MSLAFPFCICSILQTLPKFKSFASLNYDYHRNTRRSQPFCIAFHFLLLLQRPHPHDHFALAAVVPVRIRNGGKFHILQLWFAQSVKAALPGRLHTAFSFSFDNHTAAKQL